MAIGSILLLVAMGCGGGGDGDGNGNGDGNGVPLDICGNGLLDDGEMCDDGNAVSGDGCNATCSSEEICGNGVVDAVAGEQCDDGNLIDGDDCSSNCQAMIVAPGCGNGIIESGEVCEDGNNTSGDGCSADCLSAEVCGNDVLDVGEECDDGNVVSGDGCSSRCASEGCGNGLLELDEGCDDGNQTGGDGCSATCLLESCGNGVLDVGESCDDGNAIDSDLCPRTCRFATCGDGFVHAGIEECDDGNRVAGDDCSPRCRLEGCGNGLLDPGEGCDDGNDDHTDACAACRPAVCGDGFIRAGVEQCDDSNTTSGDGCSDDCLSDESCGNGVIDVNEVCDDGNLDNGDACANCELAVCGDGFVRRGDETCDDGNLVDGDGCSSRCVFDGCGSGTVEGGEQCDQGSANSTQGASCFATCLSTEVRFAAPRPFRLDLGSFGRGAISLASGDLNGDGHLDVAVVNNASSTITLGYGMGDGQVWTPQVRGAGSAPEELRIIDVNGDDLLDVITVNANSNTLSVFRGNGFGIDNATTHSIVVGTAGSRPRDLAVADVTGDGELDVVTANEDSDNITLLTGNGAGGFTATAVFGTIVGSGGDGPFAIAAADVNGDTRLDLVTSNVSSDDIMVRLSLGNGNFAPAEIFSTRVGAGGDDPRSLAVVDVTNDGVLDVITANQTSDDITVLVGNGDGTFQLPLRFSTLDGSGGGDEPNALVIADVTGDGVLDAITANQASDDVTVLAGMAASPSFAAPVTFSTRNGAGGDVPIDLAVTDLDGDGIADILTINTNSNDISVLLGTGGGQFAAAETYASSAGYTGLAPAALGVGDFTSDGRLDVVAVNRSTSNLTVVAGYGDGTLAPAQTISTSSDPRSVALGDLDGDGRLDWVVAEHNSAATVRRGRQLVSGDFQVTSFTARVGCCDGESPASVALGNIDSDGDLDLITAADLDRGAVTLRNSGAGSFSSPSFFNMAASGTVPHVILADVTGDNNLDMIGVSPERDEVNYRAGNGLGSFSSTVVMSTAESTSGQGPVFVATADVNLDGITDILTANRDSNDVSLLIGLGSGSFTPPVIVPATFSAASADLAAVQVGDLNGDGLPDLVTVNRDRDDVSVIMGFGNGAFAAPQSFPAGNDPRAAVVGDMNGDGIDDIVVGNFASNDLIVLDGLGLP